jgi:hypothetical protein
LKHETYSGVQKQHSSLTEVMRRLGEEKAAEEDPGVGACGHKANFGELAVTDGNEIFDDPA